MGEMIAIKRPDGSAAKAYFVDAKGPGVVVLQEWWGLQGQIKSICDRLAKAGYAALAPDLYDGFVADYHDTAGAERAMGALDGEAATAGAIRGAALHLKSQGRKVGLTGFCLGGLLTALGAMRIKEIDAGAAFYGLPSPQAGDPGKLSVPLQGHFANTDDWCSPSSVDAFEKASRAAPVPPEIFRYDAQHGFMNQDRPQYDAAAAALSWDRMMGFWRRHLGG
ncbi:MAG: dienelactone hydrolase family protein [Alphaproteobacteria bacterium]